jgi:hypothetical protein
MSKALLAGSAAFLIALGLAFNFAPAEAATTLGLEGANALPLQLLAGALIGVGLLNWYSREAAFGGIYGRPMGLANILLFVVGSFALGRAAFAGSSPALWVVFACYAVFATGFIWIVFVGPRASPTRPPQTGN